MSQEKIYLTQAPTNISNYKGIFETGEYYEKFDFVYDEQDKNFYYAKDNVSNSNAVISGVYRFSLDPSAPSLAGEDTFYIFDEYNNSDDLETGQKISLQGSSFDSDGIYKILSIEKDFDDVSHSSEVYDFDSIFEAESLGSNWYTSSWFFRPNVGEDSFLDGYSAFAKSSSSFIYHLLFGWIYIHLIEDGDKTFWFTDGGGKGLWFYANKQLLGNASNPDSNSFLKLENRGESRIAGSDSWLYWRNDPNKKYKALFYNYTDFQWFGFNSFSDMQKITSPNFEIKSFPSEVIESLNSDGRNTRIRVSATNNSYSINQYEIRGQNNITLSGILSNPSEDPDSWVSNRFFFDADYGSSVSFKANNYRHEYGNGYYILQPRNINSLSFEVDLKFKNRTNREANAIVHFLESHQGKNQDDKPLSYLNYTQGISGFNWDGASTFHPYDSLDIQTKAFYCQDFSHSLNFENSNDINVKLRNLDTSLLQKSNSLFVSSSPTYSDDEYYEKNDVVFYTGNNEYYYCASGDGQSQGLPPVEMHEEWSRENGNFSHINTGQWTRDFFWKPSIGLNVSQKPRLSEINLGAGYTQIYQDGINDNLLTLDLQFNNRSDSEAYAILHFLEQRCGYIPFMFSAPAPYEAPHNFVCEEWLHTYNYKNNHSIQATFKQYPIDLSSRKILDNVTPAAQSDAEIIISNIVEFSSQEDVDLISDLGKGSYIKKRIYIENIGDKQTVVDSLYLSEDTQDYYIVGYDDFGSLYTPDGFDRNNSLTTADIENIYLDINEEEIQTTHYYEKAEAENWTVGDLVYSLLNDEHFLSKVPTIKSIQIIHKDLTNESAFSTSSYLNLNSLNEVKNLIESSSKRSDYLRLNPKIVTKKIIGSDRRFCIPDNRLKDVGLNGKKIQIKKQTNEGINFKVISEDKNYFQNHEGVIFDLARNESLRSDDLYFIDQRLFELHGTGTINGGEQGYIDIYFQASEEKDSFLVDSSGSLISWTDYSESEQGYIRIGRGITLITGLLNLEFQGNVSECNLNTWAKFIDSEIQEEEIRPWVYEDIISSPFLAFGGQTFIKNDSSIEAEDNVIYGYVIFETDTDGSFQDFQDIWIPYQVEVYSEEGDYEAYVDSDSSILALYDNYVSDGGEKDKQLWGFEHWIENGNGPPPIGGASIFFPRNSVFKSGNQNIPVNTTKDVLKLFEMENNSSELRINTKNIDQSIVNTESHTLFSVESIDFQDLPPGYTSGYIQKGIVKVENTSSGEVATLRKSFVDNFFKTSEGKSYPVALIPCWLDNSNSGVGTIKISTDNFASDYGIVNNFKNSSSSFFNQKYNLVKKSFGFSDEAYEFLDYEEWKEYINFISVRSIDGSFMKEFPFSLVQSKEILLSAEEYANLAVVPGRVIDGRAIVGKQFFESLQRKVSEDLTIENAIREWNLKNVNKSGEILYTKFTLNNQCNLSCWKHVYNSDEERSILKQVYAANYPDGTMELVENGAFEAVADGNVGYDNGDGTVDGWGVIAGAKLSIVNNQLKVEHGGNNNARTSISIPTIVGKDYRLSAEVVEASNSSNTGRILFSDPTDDLNFTDIDSESSGSIEFTARHEETLVVLNSLSSGPGTYVIFDNISVRQINYLDNILSLQKSSLPAMHGDGLRIDIDYAMNLEDNLKEEINAAASTLESIVQQGFSIKITVIEDQHNRLHEGNTAQNIVKIRHSEKEFLKRGLHHFDRSQQDLYFGNGFSGYLISEDNHFLRRISAVISINPEKIRNAEYSQRVSVNYDPASRTPLYYAALHEMLSMMGLGYLWNENRVWSLDDGDLNSIYNLSEPAGQYIGTNGVEEYLNLLESWSQAGEVFNVNDYERYIDENPTVLQEYEVYLAQTPEEDQLSKNEWGTNHWFSSGINDDTLTMSKNNQLVDYYTIKLPLADNGSYLRSAVKQIDDEVSSKIQPSIPGEIMTDFGLIARAPATPITNPGAALSRISIGMLKDLGYNVSYGPARPDDDLYLKPDINLK
jgi:phage-related protein